MKDLMMAIFVGAWLAGTVLAKGFWLTAFAALFPPVAWYFVVERAMLALGLT